MHRLQLSTAAVNGALLLILSLVENSVPNHDRYTDVFRKTIVVLLFALSKLKLSVGYSGDDRVIIALDTCGHALKNMVVKVIGGSFFGGQIQRSGELIFAQKELKV